MSYTQKMSGKDIQNCDPNIFGTWTENLDTLQQEFSSQDFPHVIIPNFLRTDVAEKACQDFPEVDNSWYKYCNPIEVKYANDQIDQMSPTLSNIFCALSHPKLVQNFSQVCQVPNLEYDPYLHGAGLHAHPRNGRLGVHLDYEEHIMTGKQRRLNVILYLTKNWQADWNGHTEMWNPDMTERVGVSPIAFNQALVFQTSDLSWHGLPDKIQCPAGLWRKSLAYYYVSPFEAQRKKVPRKKAVFTSRPTDPVDVRMEKLYSIRPNRRITEEDMQEIWPEWTPEL